MQRATKLFFAALMLCCSVSVWAGSYYYQPTPYPSLTSSGGSMPQTLDVIHIHDGWLNSYYPGLMTFQRDDKLKNGGWGDIYRSYVNFDLTGLPNNPNLVVLWLYNYSTPGYNATPIRFCIPNSTWNTTITWSTQPSVLGCSSYFSTTQGIFNGWDITSWYQNWQSGTWSKYGFLIDPQYTNNNHGTEFRTSRYADYINDPYADGKRPILQFDFTPTLQLKLPLPSGFSWQLSNETGGYECKYSYPSPDTAHQGTNYFSLDFTWKNSGSTYGSTNTPILAAAGGKVADVGYTSGNGYYIVIDHDGDGSVYTGFQTRYLHLVAPAARKNGTALAVNNTVQQGDQIGIMGNTGASTGTHLHFGVRYANDGASTISQMTKVVMEDMILRNYQTECSVNGSGVPQDWIRYYYSSNTPTGN